MFWIIEGLLIGVVRISKLILVFLIECVLKPIELSPELFLTYFKSIDSFLPVIQGAGILLATGIFVFQLLKVMFYQTAASKTDSPLGMIVKYVLSIALILSTIQLGSFSLTVAKIPFGISNISNSDNSEISKQVKESIENIDKQVSEYTKNSFNEKSIGAERKNDYSTRDEGLGLVVGVITLILIAGLGLSYVVFIIKIISRYLITFVTFYLSPFAWSTIISVNTASIFRKYLELVVSNLVLIFIDMLLLKILLIGLNIGFGFSSTTGLYNPLLSVAILMALANIATTIDAKMGNLLAAMAGSHSFGRELLFYSKSAFMNTLSGRGEINGDE